MNSDAAFCMFKLLHAKRVLCFVELNVNVSVGVQQVRSSLLGQSAVVAPFAFHSCRNAGLVQLKVTHTRNDTGCCKC